MGQLPNPSHFSLPFLCGSYEGDKRKQIHSFLPSVTMHKQVVVLAQDAFTIRFFEI
jgi:hypothetical protein